MGYKSVPEYSGYTLDIFTEQGYVFVENLTLSELAAACYRATASSSYKWPEIGTPFPWRARFAWPMSSSEVAPYLNLVAKASSGKRLDVNLLLRWHSRKLEAARAWRWARRRLENWNGEGPVPGTRKRSRYGNYIRRPYTQAERRDAVWLEEEGEPPIRASRRANYLPTRWDDMPRHTERCWKRQHKGRKAWDKG